MRCGDCKHWGTAEEAERGAEFRKCQGVTDDPEWLLNDPSEAGQAFRASHIAITEESDCHWSALMTKAEFGCILFQPKGGA